MLREVSAFSFFGRLNTRLFVILPLGNSLRRNLAAFAAIVLNLCCVPSSDRTGYADMQTLLYGYQISPGNDEPLYFTQSLDDCRKAAIEQRAELLRDPDYANIGPMAVYECLVRCDVATLVDVLNDPDVAIKRAVISRVLCAVVMD